MFTITVNKDPDGVVAYFTNSLSKDDYFFSKKSIPGRWHGALAKELGLPERISKKTFSRLAHNRYPHTGDLLTQRQSKERRSSIEYTFSAPKSVSVIMALSDKDEGRAILNAHRRAVMGAMAAIEQDMQTQTRLNGRKTYVTTGNIVFGRFDHFTARPTKLENDDLAKYASDPQLHSHCVVMNCTSYHGRLQAIEGSTVHRMARFYEALYHSALAKNLADLGYTIERTQDRWEIKSPGMTRRTLTKFSRRTQEIEAVAKRRGITNPKTKAALGAKTRVSKTAVKEDTDLLKIWTSRLTAIEHDAIVHAKRRSSKTDTPITAQVAVQRSLDHHLERQSTVATKRVLAHALTLGYGTLTLSDVRNALAKREEILYAQRGYLEYLTTKEMVRAEDRMLTFAAGGKGWCNPIHSSYQVQRDFLNQDQRRAIDKLLMSRDRVSILSGAAGVGKSTLLQEIHRAAREKNKHIVAVASTSSASRDVLRGKGFKTADTIARFLNDKTMQRQLKNNILLVDEASMIGVRTMNRLFDAARQYNGRVILCGDSRQHSAPAAGDALRLLQDKAGLKVISVDTILRQRKNPAYKQAIDLLAGGRSAMGFKALCSMGAVKEEENTAKRHAQLARDYAASRLQNRSALVVSPTHAEGRKITQAIRREMKTRGRIDDGERDITMHRLLSFTQAQKQDIAQYEKGQIIQFHQHVKGGYRAGQVYEIVSKSPRGGIKIKSARSHVVLDLPLHAPDRFQVFQKETIAIAKGDQICITKNGTTCEGSRLHNGQVVGVTGFTSAGHLSLSNGKTLDKDFANITYGYVRTSHAAQGRTAKDVFVAMGAMSFPAVNQKTFYVSASRGAETVRIYTDDTRGLLTAIQRHGERMNARDIADHQMKQKHCKKSKWRQRNRARHYLTRIKATLTHDQSRGEIAQEKLSGPIRDVH